MAYVIYRIWNSEIGKSYVGLTRNYRTRIGAHFNDLKREKHSNPLLQSDFNFYGFDAFKVEALELGIEDAQLASEREIYWINAYDGYGSGYNRSTGGERGSVKTTKKLKPVTWNDKVYKSIADAARAIDVSRAVMWYRIKRGYTRDSDMTRKASVITPKKPRASTKVPVILSKTVYLPKVLEKEKRRKGK